MERAKRMELNEMSLQVYGKAGAWQRMVKKGELKEENALTAAGNPITVKRWYPISPEEAEKRMTDILVANATAKAAALKHAEESNGSEVQTQQEA